MSEDSEQAQIVYWPRVKEILDRIMARWIERWGRQPLPGIHAYYWETSQELKDSVLSGLRSIEPGIPGLVLVSILSLSDASVLGGWFTPEKFPGLGSCISP